MDKEVTDTPLEKKGKDIRPQNIHQSIELMTELLAREGIQKQRVENYQARGIDQIRNTISPLQKQCALYIKPTVIAHTQREFSTKSGGRMMQTILEVEFILTNTINESSVVCRFFGEANNTSDKGTQVAMSQAYKTMAINIFNIPTEGEEDSDTSGLEIGTHGVFATTAELTQYKENCIMAFEAATTVNQLKETEGFYHDKLVLMANSSNNDEKKARAEISNIYLNKLNSIKENTKGSKL